MCKIALLDLVFFIIIANVLAYLQKKKILRVNIFSMIAAITISLITASFLLGKSFNNWRSIGTWLILFIGSFIINYFLARWIYSKFIHKLG